MRGWVEKHFIDIKVSMLTHLIEFSDNFTEFPLACCNGWFSNYRSPCHFQFAPFSIFGWSQCVWVIAAATANAMPIARTFVIHTHETAVHSLGKMQIDGGNVRVFVSLWLLPNCPLSLLPGVMLMSLHRAEQPHFGISEWQIKLIHFHLWSRVWDVESSAQGKSFILYKQQLLLKLSTVYILYCQNRLFEWYKTFL